MKRIQILSITLISVFSLLFLIRCRDLPSDPSQNPNNVSATLDILDLASGVSQDSPVTIKIIVHYPYLTKQLKISFDQTIPDTIMYCDNETEKLSDTLFVTRSFSTTGNKTVTATVEATNGMFKQFSSVTFDVKEKSLTVLFDKIPQDHIIETGKADTMTFSATTNSAESAIEFSVESEPKLDTTHLFVNDLGTTAKVITTATSDTVYNIKVSAICGNIRKAVQVSLTSKTKPALTEFNSVTVVNPGYSDTLSFTVQARLSDTVKLLQLLNSDSFTTGEILLLPSSSGTLNFIFTPSETKTYTFYIETTVNSVKDTVPYAINVIKPTSIHWKQDTATVTAVAGAVLDLPLVHYLSDTTLSGPDLVCTKGTITNKNLSYDVPSGLAGRDSIIITANGTSDPGIKIYLNIIIADIVKPLITRLSPSDSVITTSTSSFECSFVITDPGSGINNVTFSFGTTVITDSARTDNTYKYTVIGLSHGVKTPLKVVATDNSPNKNRDSIITYLTFDSTATDTSCPVISLVNPANDSTSISSPSINVVVSCTDNNDIANVKCMIGTNEVPVAKADGTNFIATVSGLVDGPNTIVFTATDKSSKANATSKQITIIYDSTIADNVPPVVRLLNPSVNSDTVFTDTVTVIISARDKNGIASVNCTRAGNVLSVSNSADSLYSVKLTALTEGGRDTVKFTVTDKSSGANKFELSVILKYTTFVFKYNGNGNTGGNVPAGAVSFQKGTQATVEGNTLSLVKTDYSFGGWNTAADGNGTNYIAGDKIVMNSDITLYAKWTIIPKYKVIYKGNHNSSGTVPVDANSYTANTSATVMGNINSLERSGFTFTGWNTDSTGNGTAYSAGSPLTITASDVTLYASWSIISPVITQNLSDVNADAGDNVTLTVAAAPIAGVTMQYSWQKNGTPINGATGASLLLTGVTRSDSATYKCIVSTNAGGSTPSSSALISVVSIKAVSAGAYHCAILKSDGTLWTVGSNFRGQLGDGTETDRSTPQKVLSNVSYITTGYQNTFAIKNDGSLWGCGKNDYGQLGNGLTTQKDAFIPIMSGTTITAVSAGDINTMMITSDGTLYSCGNNVWGQVGDGTKTERNSPVQIMTDVKSVSVGYKYALILKKDGSLWGCGCNDKGQLGVLDSAHRESPVLIMSASAGVSSMSASYNHTLILKSNGAVFGCGYNYSGQLGNGSSGSTDGVFTPEQVITGVKSLCAGNIASFVIKNDGTLWVTGKNNWGQLGDGTTENKSSFIQIPVISNAASVSSNETFTITMKSDGTALTNGFNGSGQLCDGTTANSLSPVKVICK